MSIAIFDNLVAHYRMDDNAASMVVIDRKGYSNGEAVRNTNLMHVAGKIGGALNFDDSNDCVKLSKTFTAVMKSDLTVAYGFKTDDGQGGSFRYLFGLWDEHEPPENEISMYIDDAGGLSFDYRANGSYFTPSVHTPVVFVNGVNDWKFIILVIRQYSPTQIQGLVYVNGLLIFSQLSTGVMSQYQNAEEYGGFAYPYIGAVNAYDEYGGHRFGNNVYGALDNFMIFNKDLTATEALWLYNKLKQTGAGEGLISAQARMAVAENSISAQSRLTAKFVAEPDND